MSNTFSKVDVVNFDQVNAGWANSYEVEIISVHWLGLQKGCRHLNNQ